MSQIRLMTKNHHPKIRVLRLLSRMNVGGPSCHVIHLTEGLRKKGYDARLAVGLPSSAEGSRLKLAADAGVRPVVIPCLDRPVSTVPDIIAFRELVRIIRDFRPHIVHTHTTKVGILGRLAAVFCRVPIILHTFHGHVFSGYFSDPVSLMIVGFERFLTRFTDRIITLTPGLKDDLLNRFRIKNQKRIEVIRLGLDLRKNLNTNRYSSGFKSKLGIPENSFLMGIVARVVPVKNHTTLIRALSQLRMKFSNLHLAVVGGGEIEQDLKLLAKNLGVSDRVHFTGIIDNIEGVYSDLDLLVLSSHNEGTPVVLIEALASGCPVAATRVGGVPELLAEGRYGSFIRKDLKGMVADLERQIVAGRQELGSDLRQEIADSYVVEDLLNNMDRLYKQLLQKRGLL
jgi:glycosyltransferase involved in cell wall biosynthesis